jgi:S1-C subfamily serine protease
MIDTLLQRTLGVLVASVLGLTAVGDIFAAESIPEVAAQVAPKVVKIFGAGGRTGLEAYQSGLLISSEGHVLTAWSYVLDTDNVTVTLADGRNRTAELVGIDPTLEIAVLKLAAGSVTSDLPHFKLPESAALERGSRVLAFANLYGSARGDEVVSVQRGVVAGKSTLSAKRGTFKIPYQGEVYILDAITNNPGAAGGIVTDRRGQLVAMLGKELRSTSDGAWLNYAVPIQVVAPSVEQILAGKTVGERPTGKPKKPTRAHTLSGLGLSLVPDVLNKTPPYVDLVSPGGIANRAGIKPDDLVLFVNDRLVASSKVLVDELSQIPVEEAVRVTVKRGLEVVEVTLDLFAPAESKTPNATNEDASPQNKEQP